MFFDELSNDEWALLAALVSDEPAVRLNRRGRPRAEPRIVANAVLWILTTGEPWSKLPGRYPSGPTCRRRFEEWQLNGTLLEMVRLLSQTGRTFAYIPQPAAPVAAKPVAPVAQAPGIRDEGLRGVSWKSPESWQAPGVSGALSRWRSADPIADITRQLSGLASPAPVSRTHALCASQPVMRANLPAGMGEVRAVGAAMECLDSAIASARRAQARDDQRNTLPTNLAPRGTPIADRHGYLVYVVAERVPNAMYRGWAEITKDGKRVERSGLVGPRFADSDAAEQFALEWARQWIDRECLTRAAADPAASTHAPVPVARPLPALRHVPEPVAAAKAVAVKAAAVNHGAPLQGALNAFRGPLRRYPGAPVTAITASIPTASGVSSAATENSGSERFSLAYIELISHVG